MSIDNSHVDHTFEHSGLCPNRHLNDDCGSAVYDSNYPPEGSCVQQVTSPPVDYIHNYLLNALNTYIRTFCCFTPNMCDQYSYPPALELCEPPQYGPRDTAVGESVPRNETELMNDINPMNLYHELSRLYASMSNLMSLPKFELPTFDGDVKTFYRFMNSFETHIEAKVPEPSRRLHYLLHYCKGDAYRLVDSCLNYEP